MGNYNLKVYEYADGIQIRLYNQPISTNEKVPPVPLAVPQECDELQRVHTSELSHTHGKVHTSELLDSLEKVHTSEPPDRQRGHAIQSSMNRTIQKIYEISRANIWEYFLTLTFDRNKLDSSDYNLLCDKVSKWLNNLRSRYAPDLKYLIVPELHKDGVHYHFHGLLANIGNITLTDSGIKKNGHTIYNMANWKYGFSTVSKVAESNKVSSYITKYITKELCAVSKNKRRYWSSKNCETAKVSVYNLPYEEIGQFIDNNIQSIRHTSKVVVESAGLTINYIEMEKGERSHDKPTN